jgi:hypothetical protein
MSTGNPIKGHHEAFLMALEAAWQEDRVLPMAAETVLTLRLSAAGPVKVISVEARMDAPGTNDDAMPVKAQPQARLRIVAAHDRAFTQKVGDPQTAALFGAVVQRRAGKRDGTRNIKAPDPPAQGSGPFPTPPKGTRGGTASQVAFARLHRTEPATACPLRLPLDLLRYAAGR